MVVSVHDGDGDGDGRQDTFVARAPSRIWLEAKRREETSGAARGRRGETDGDRLRYKWWAVTPREHLLDRLSSSDRQHHTAVLLDLLSHSIRKI